MFDTHACHIRALLSGSSSKKQILTNTCDEQIFYLQCFTYPALSGYVPSLLCITEVELNAPLPFPVWVLSQAQDQLCRSQ